MSRPADSSLYEAVTRRHRKVPGAADFAAPGCSALPSFSMAESREPARWIPILPETAAVEEEEEEEEELWTDEGDEDYSGWFCVRTDSFPCPAAGCDFVAGFMTAAHLILVWEERDDPNLLRHAQRAKEVGRNPQVVEYEPRFGAAASYYAWEAAGRRVHGVRR